MDTAAGVGHLCPVCGRSVSAFGRGPGGRANASCPHCGSLERHRLVAFVLGGAGPLLAGAGALQVGPGGAVTPVLTGPAPHLAVHTLDAAELSDAAEISDADADPDPDVGQTPGTGSAPGLLPFADDSFDLVVGTQVFDAPGRDGLAGEFARVLRSGGVAVLYDSADPSAQLTAVGLSARSLRVADLAGPELVRVLGLAPGDAVVVARAAAGGPDPAAGGPDPAADGAVPAARGERQVLGEWAVAALAASEQARAAAVLDNEILQSRLAALEASLIRRAERAERVASGAQARYDSLRGRLPLRVASAVVDRAAAALGRGGR